ncbi:MAG: anaerobic carbon-monoxide dehydrogenase catalytic subunit [Phycisphaerae bacterium]|nr:anaerobic carbon-monoxide dehydrogenase catalytic subunit [Phycisphaerae bacterium]
MAKSKATSRSMDPATQEVLRALEKDGQAVDLSWDRCDAQQPQCGFGQLGLCCRHCAMGPCRIDPFGNGPKVGICGANADVIAARVLVRMIAAGAAAHSDHGRDVAHTLLEAAKGDSDYKVTDVEKVTKLAEEFGIATEGASPQDLARQVAERCFSEYGQQSGELLFAQRAPEDQKKRWRLMNAMPRGIDREIVEIMHRTHIGVDNEYKNIIGQGVRAALGDGWGGSMCATELSDVLFGRPKPIRARVNFGAMDPESVNVIVHGHEPTLSEMLVAAAQDPAIIKAAQSKGAKGVVLSGICCTANEVLMRHGMPIAGNFLQQELAVATGAVEAIVVDVQCIMPSLPEVAKHYHTKIVSTSPKAKFEGAMHIQFDEHRAMEIAKDILTAAIDNFPNRNREIVHIPDIKNELVAGFSTENVYEFLGGRYRPSYRPLNDAVISGRFRGACAIVGCNNPKMRHDEGHVELTKELLANDVIVVTTGCTAIADAKYGLLDPKESLQHCGHGIREVCRAVGIPPVLHQGSCVDISRILVVLSNMVKEGGLGESIADLPAAGAAPEWMSEKAVSIGFYVAASGAYTVLGVPFPVQGAKNLTEYLTNGMEKDYGGKFAFEPDPVKASRLILDHIDKKRQALGLPAPMYPVPYLGIWPESQKSEDQTKAELEAQAKADPMMAV